MSFVAGFALQSQQVLFGVFAAFVVALSAVSGLILLSRGNVKSGAARDALLAKGDLGLCGWLVVLPAALAVEWTCGSLAYACTLSV